MAVIIMKLSRAREITTLRSALQLLTFPITSIKLSLNNLPHSWREYSANLWFHTTPLGL